MAATLALANAIQGDQAFVSINYLESPFQETSLRMEILSVAKCA
jgi:hypothetical protein